MKRSAARSKDAIEFAKQQRATANEFALTVWQWIRNGQCCRQKFRREYPIPPYTVDFCCVDLQLVIEIDGEPHFTPEGIERDRTRDQFLRHLGYQVLRIKGYDVIRDGREVIERIHQCVECRMAELGGTRNPSPPAPLPAASPPWREAGRGEQ